LIRPRPKRHNHDRSGPANPCRAYLGHARRRASVTRDCRIPHRREARSRPERHLPRRPRRHRPGVIGFTPMVAIHRRFPARSLACPKIQSLEREPFQRTMQERGPRSATRKAADMESTNGIEAVLCVFRSLPPDRYQKSPSAAQSVGETTPRRPTPGRRAPAERDPGADGDRRSCPSSCQGRRSRRLPRATVGHRQFGGMRARARLARAPRVTHVVAHVRGSAAARSGRGASADTDLPTSAVPVTPTQSVDRC
jgi:hypothetical protein